MNNPNIDKIKYPVDPAAFVSDEEVDGEESELGKVNRLLADIEQHRPICTASDETLVMNVLQRKHGITRHEADVIYEIAGRIRK